MVNLNWELQKLSGETLYKIPTITGGSEEGTTYIGPFTTIPSKFDNAIH